MKYIIFFLGFNTLLFSCSDDSNNDVDIETNMPEVEEEQVLKENLISPGEFVEYHPNGEIKMKGRYNSKNLRTGLWISYYDNGQKWSESYYVNGNRDGHSLTFYPNGQIRYRGEYKMEKKIGDWTFYDESGTVVRVENN